MNKQDIQTVLNALQNSQLFVQASSNINVLEGFGQQLDDADEAIALLRAFLAEPSEPVAEVAGDYNTKHIIFLPAGIALEVGDKLFTHPAPSKPSLADIRGAVARGWCTERNAYKTMDVDLAEDIADAVWEEMNG